MQDLQLLKTKIHLRNRLGKNHYIRHNVRTMDLISMTFGQLDGSIPILLVVSEGSRRRKGMITFLLVQTGQHYGNGLIIDGCSSVGQYFGGLWLEFGPSFAERRPYRLPN